MEFGEIRGLHGGEYKDHSLLDVTPCIVIQLVTSQATVP